MSTLDTSIRADGIAKRYRVGTRQRYVTLRDSIANAVTSLSRRRAALKRSPDEDSRRIWALNDVSFEIRRGEVVGVIGRNGAGKSTLLKILARVTKPTAGSCLLRGRIGSLLEVGTGFHPELTGRENVYLSGAILGMRRSEIQRKFDEIVAFAEVERFLDTPIKHYSSGMNLRLAFAVAAHLETEILLIDEVLAVGDMAFQKKCLSRVTRIAKEDRTVLFVSHNMAAVVALCKRGLLLDRGRVIEDGTMATVADRYHSLQTTTGAQWQRDMKPTDDSAICISAIRVADSSGVPCAWFASDERAVVEIEYEVSKEIAECQIIARVDNAYGMMVFVTGDTDAAGESGAPREPGRYQTRFAIAAHLLSPGRYTLSVRADFVGYHIYDSVTEAVAFDISSAGSADSSSKRGSGVIAPKILWRTNRVVQDIGATV